MHFFLLSVWVARRGAHAHKLTHLLRCCKILPNYGSGLMYYSTLRFQNFLRLAYGQLFNQTQVTGQVLIRLICSKDIESKPEKEEF